MFLDTTTSISDSTLSSQAPSSPTTTGNIDTNKSSTLKPKSLAANDPISNCHKEETCQTAERRALSSTSHNRAIKGAISNSVSSLSSSELIQSILFESICRIKRWLSASVGALWATLSFINHFIETRLARGLPPIASGANIRSPPELADSRQLGWRGTSMISFYNSQQQLKLGLEAVDDPLAVGEINPCYLSVINRARKWSEEAAIVLGDIEASKEEENNNASWCESSLFGSSNNIYPESHCFGMDQDRGRVAQRASSQYNSRPQAGSSSSPLALPLHSLACLQQASYPDALQIQRQATAYGTAAGIGSSGSEAAGDKRDPGIEALFGGAQQQTTPTDFQGQSAESARCGPSSFQSSTTPEELKYHHHHHQQQQQQRRQHQQHQCSDQAPPEQSFGLSRALLGMLRAKGRASQEYSSSCTQRTDNQDRSSGDAGASRPERDRDRPQCKGDLIHKYPINNNAPESDRSSSLILVSKSTLNNLTEQIAFSMNKMKDLEEKVRVIPELQRRLHSVISDNTSSSFARTDSSSSSIGIRDSKYNSSSNNNNNNNDLDHVNYSASSTRLSGGNFPRRSSLHDGHDVPYKTMFSSSLRQPCGSSMRYSPGSRVGNLIPQQAGSDLARANSFSLSSPYTTNRQRYFDKLARGSNINGGIGNQHGNSRQSLDMSTALRPALDSLSSSRGNLIGPTSKKVEYEELINDLISLSYSVNYLSSNDTNSEDSRSSGDNRSQVKLDRHSDELDAIRTSKLKRHIQSKSNNRHQQHVVSTQPSLPSTYHSTSTGANNNHNQNSTFSSSMNHSSSPHHHARDNNHLSTSHLARNHNNGSGSLSLQTTPVKTQLDCGCQSFKEHLRYNSISRELRLNGAKSQQTISQNGPSNGTSNNGSPQPPTSHKADASTNTELSMNDLVSKSELSKLVDDIHKTYSSSVISRSASNISHLHDNNNATRNISTSTMSDSSGGCSSGSATGPNSSSQPESRSTSSVDDRFDDDEDEHEDNDDDEEEEEISDDNVGMKTNSSGSAKDISEDHDPDKEVAFDQLSLVEPDRANDKGTKEENDDDDEEIEVNLNSIDGAEEAYSLGSSYQDPSDFEEYCAYGESLDRRTKDFLSQTTKIPNDLRFALIRLNDSIRKDRPLNQIESSSNCIDVIRKEWFEVAASKDAQAVKTKLYVDFFESFTKQLLNMVVNLTDQAGNTAMHYAASHFKLDIIEILLGTKVCDVNCRNKAGYTPIMLLALAELEETYEQEVARYLFSMGDVNVKARSSGQTALMLAASHGRVSTCKLLLECGADPSLQDYDGSTALMCGSELGNEDVVRCLLAHRLTDPNATDNDGLDALTIAMNNGHKSIGLILYAAKNVPRMTRSAIQQSSCNKSSRLISSATPNYLGASLRRTRGKSVIGHVRRADSLLGQRHTHSARQLGV